jgi:hypothetical protein
MKTPTAAGNARGQEKEGIFIAGFPAFGNTILKNSQFFLNKL